MTSEFIKVKYTYTRNISFIIVSFVFITIFQSKTLFHGFMSAFLFVSYAYMILDFDNRIERSDLK